MRVAIHQPCFFPWLGLFHKIRVVDRFVLFDHVPAPRGKSWISRNKILLRGEPVWLTIPIERAGRGRQRVSAIRINHRAPFERKHLGTLRQAYQKQPHFEDVYDLVERLYRREFELLNDFNVGFTAEVCRRLDLSATLISSTELGVGHPELARLGGNELTLETCRAAGGTEYVSGLGCTDFIRPRAFEEAGIGFWFQDFADPEYPQRDTCTFVPRLSILDALFSVGFDGVKELISADMLFRPTVDGVPEGVSLATGAL